MNFLIIGHGGCYNRGCEAILRSTLIMIREKFDEPEITIATFDYLNDRLVDFGSNARLIPSHIEGVWKRWTWPWIIRQLCRILSQEKSEQIEYLPVISAIKKADVVMSVGGDNFTMDYGFPRYFLYVNRLAKKYRKKLIIWAASIGPFPDDERRKYVVDNLSLADLITVREQVTMNHLMEMGIKKTVKKVADPAFLLPVQEVNLENIIPKDAFLKNGILGINVSPLLKRYTNKSDCYIINEICSFLRQVMRDRNLYVILIPHVTNENDANNDYLYMRTIHAAMQDSGAVSIIPPNYNAMQMKYIISKCRFFIGARTHATIAAFSMNVPTISIGYSVKSLGINEEIFGNSNYLINIANLTSENLLEKFNQLYMNESSIRENLMKKGIQLNKMAKTNADYLVETVYKT